MGTIKKNAVITVEPEIWERFKRETRLNESDASKELRKFMKRYLETRGQKRSNNAT